MGVPDCDGGLQLRCEGHVVIMLCPQQSTHDIVLTTSRFLQDYGRIVGVMRLLPPNIYAFLTLTNALAQLAFSHEFPT